MADLPISQLPAASFMNGTDLFAIVQSGITKKITKNSAIPSYYGAWYDTKTQTNIGTANQSKPLSADTTQFSYGITQSAGTITFQYAGKYNIQFSAQISKTDAGSDTISVWLNKGNTPVDYTNTDITLQGQNALQVASWNFFVEAQAGDTFSIRWSSADANAQIKAVAGQSNPTRPAIPSVILTISQIA